MVPSQILTIVAVGQNDDYNEDNLYRLEVFLNLTADHLENLGLLNEVEIVFVDYLSATPITNHLQISSTAKSITRFLYVNSDGAEHLVDRTFDTSKSLNIGIKAAKGRFVAVQALDLLLTRSSLYSLLSILSGKLSIARNLETSVLTTPRRLIPREFGLRQPSFISWQRLLERVSSRCGLFSDNDYYPSVGSGTGALIAKKDHYLRLCGFDERFTGWGFIDNDFIIRASRFGTPIDLGAYGIVHYKPEYSKNGRRAASISDKNTVVPKRQNPHWLTLSNIPPSPAWGETPHDVAEIRLDEVVDKNNPNTNRPLRDYHFTDANFKNFREGLWPEYFKLTELKKLLIRIFPDVKIYARNDYEVFVTLFWCIETKLPYSVLLVGSGSGLELITFIASKLKMSSICILEVVESDLLGRTATGVHELSKPLKHSGHIGETWLLAGAFDNLFYKYSTDSNSDPPELVIFRLDALKREWIRIIEWLVELQNVNSFLVFVSNDNKRLLEVHDLLIGKYPQSPPFFIGNGSHLGMIISTHGA